MPPVLSTYRLQLHPGFTLDDARALVPYLRSLGVTHMHCSPLFRARRGSTHGYDVADPSAVNPELGGERAFAELAAALRAAGMGMVLDIVPNHMVASSDNAYWEDVLTHGPASPYVRWFDIDWRAAEREDPGSRVLLPVLGDLRVHVIARGELQVEFIGGRFRIRYYENSWPLDPATLAPVLDAAARLCADRADPADEGCAELRAIAGALRGLPRRAAKSPDARARRRREGEAAMVRVAELARLREPVAAALAEVGTSYGAWDEGRRRVRRLLDAQAYRLVYWRRAAREINYRRFFDINDLVALRMEDRDVFQATHRRVLEWIRGGDVDGLRIDHPDGLLDPLAYLRLLGDAAFTAPQANPRPIWVEKILSHGETLRDSWPVAGTTGYDFLNEAEALFIAPAGYETIEADYRRIIRRPLDFASIARLSKRRVLEASFAATVRRLADRLLRLAAAETESAQVTRPMLATAIVELIASLPVYRTYVDEQTPVPAGEDRRVLAAAFADARARGRALQPALDRLGRVVFAEAGAHRPEEWPRLRFVQRLQQASGPAAAKGVEDTAFYRYVPLGSRNEVGGAPERSLSAAVADFHESNGRRAHRWPRTMLATTTHDTKRTADLRSRLDVLSEAPEEWEERVYRWRRLHRASNAAVRRRKAPDPASVYLFFQTLVGIWPLEAARPGAAATPDAACLASLRDRIAAYMLKAAREAKTQTSWVDPDEEFEAALLGYVEAALSPEAGEFLDDVGRFAGRIAWAGIWNALARTLLHLTAPGVPDLYQGDELWNFALVDPDNRRPVDLDLRRRILADVIAGAGAAVNPEERRRYLHDLVEHADDGRIKMHLIHQALELRRTRPDVFLGASYEPLQVGGSLAEQIVAFARRAGDDVAVTIVPRLLFRHLEEERSAPVGRRFWRDTTVRLPAGAAVRRLGCALSGEEIDVTGELVDVAEAFGALPAALLVNF